LHPRHLPGRSNCTIRGVLNLAELIVTPVDVTLNWTSGRISLAIAFLSDGRAIICDGIVRKCSKNDVMKIFEGNADRMAMEEKNMNVGGSRMRGRGEKGWVNGTCHRKPQPSSSIQMGEEG